jgi:hypothetical protein
MNAHRKITSRAASHQRQILSRCRLTNHKNREAVERARGKSDERVFPFIDRVLKE